MVSVLTYLWIKVLLHEKHGWRRLVIMLVEVAVREKYKHTNKKKAYSLAVVRLFYFLLWTSCCIMVYTWWSLLGVTFNEKNAIEYFLSRYFAVLPHYRTSLHNFGNSKTTPTAFFCTFCDSLRYLVNNTLILLSYFLRNFARSVLKLPIFTLLLMFGGLSCVSVLSMLGKGDHSEQLYSRSNET